MPRLRRTFPDQPGWTRRRSGKGFVYRDEHGNRLDADQVQRCKDLVIPPAWKDVWITPHPNGHLQAVGTDDAGRKQYLYHPQWRASRDAAKFDRILGFGKALSKARERVLSDIGAETMSLGDYRMMPRATFCNPQVASFGLTEQQARDEGYDVKVATFPFTANGKAHGLAKDGRLA